MRCRVQSAHAYTHKWILLSIPAALSLFAAHTVAFNGQRLETRFLHHQASFLEKLMSTASHDPPSAAISYSCLLASAAISSEAVLS